MSESKESNGCQCNNCKKTYKFEEYYDGYNCRYYAACENNNIEIEGFNQKNVSDVCSKEYANADKNAEQKSILDCYKDDKDGNCDEDCKECVNEEIETAQIAGDYEKQKIAEEKKTDNNKGYSEKKNADPTETSKEVATAYMKTFLTKNNTTAQSNLLAKIQAANTNTNINDKYNDHKYVQYLLSISIGPYAYSIYSDGKTNYLKELLESIIKENPNLASETFDSYIANTNGTNFPNVTTPTTLKYIIDNLPVFNRGGKKHDKKHSKKRKNKSNKKHKKSKKNSSIKKRGNKEKRTKSRKN